MASFSLALQSSAKSPGFFKVIVSLACTTRLRLPPSHHWNKESEFPDEVILMDRKENTWSVKLEKVENQVCFVCGWLTFVRENNVKDDNFIVFENVGPNVYSFLIFDSNTKCETGGFKGLTYVNEDEDDSQSEEPMLVEEEEFEEEQQQDEDFEEEDEFEEEEEEFEEEEQQDEDFEEEDEEEEDDKEEESFDLRGNTSNRIGPKDRMMKISKENSNRSSDIYAHEVFESRMIPRPKNPYFVIRGRGNKGNALYIPRNVIKDYNLYLQIKTIMRDNGGLEWETNLNEWGDGRRWYRGGWRSFCRTNQVREDDYCVCEFIEEAGKGLVLFVYKLKL